MNAPNRIMKFIVAHISRRDLPLMLGLSGVGALVAGIYGAIHDQMTYTIAPEYFTKFKFHQFQYADFGLHERVFVAEIGFIATWWVGFFCVWFLSRRLLQNQPRAGVVKRIAAGFLLMGGSALLFAALGFAYGLWRGPDADYTRWEKMLAARDIEHAWAFVRVAYIHNASYLGGILGFVLALCLIRPKQSVNTASMAKS